MNIWKKGSSSKNSHFQRKGVIMANKIKIDENTYECPACGYRWTRQMGMSDLSFDEEERCPCCPDCGELIEDGDDN